MRQIAETHRSDKSSRLHWCCTRCNKTACAKLSLRFVARIQTSLNSCDRSRRQNSVAVTIILRCHTRRFVAATCRGDVSQRFVETHDATNRCDTSPRQVAATNRLVWHVKITVAATESCRCDLLHEFKLVWIRAMYRCGKISASSLVAPCVRICDISRCDKI